MTHVSLTHMVMGHESGERALICSISLSIASTTFIPHAFLFFPSLSRCLASEGSLIETLVE